MTTADSLWTLLSLGTGGAAARGAPSSGDAGITALCVQSLANA